MKTYEFMPIAHRGASDYAPENTFAAFDLALQMGARHIELDVQQTADRQVVVIHDSTLDRTTSGAGPVSRRSLAELKELDAGSWFDSRFANERIPSFTEVLDRYAGRAHLHTEIKSLEEGFSTGVADIIHQHGAQEHVTITSFDWAPLAEIRRYAPHLPTGWLVREITEEVMKKAGLTGIEQLCPQATTLNAEIVRLAHDEGFTVRAWGVPCEDVMRAVVRSGADGMTVNFPDKLIGYLAFGRLIFFSKQSEEGFVER